jgi:flagellar motor protein MotB
LRYFLSLVFLFSITLAQAQSSELNFTVPSQLYAGILALSCTDDDPNGEPAETLIITETHGEFQIVNAPNIDTVTKTKNGFVVKSSTDEEFLGFIKKNNGEWSIEFLSARGILQGTCVEETRLVQNIVTSIAPKIFENANSLIYELRRDEQNASVNLANVLALLAEQQVRTANLEQENQELSRRAEVIAATLNDEELNRVAAAFLRERLEAAKATLSQKELEQLATEAAIEKFRLDLKQSEAALDTITLELNEQSKKANDTLALLDDYKRRDADNNLKITNLGSELNVALAQVAAVSRRNLALEAAEKQRLQEEKARLEAEAKTLERYKSDFFGSLRGLLEDIEGVSIVGDRFVFSSEVLFASGRAELTAAGRAEISKVANILKDVTEDIPQNIDWVLQVDGHTDDQPILAGSQFQNNWELSQARALSVVLYLMTSEQMPPRRLSANGFGEYQPINPANSRVAQSQNRRIELKLTER